MVDRTTKALLAAIAIGLWLNVVKPVYAQDVDISRIERYVRQIALGLCFNDKIC